MPPPGRNALLQQLHQAHPGITRMKALARSYMWWPDMDAEMEAFVKSCVSCQESRSSPPVAPGKFLINHGGESTSTMRVHGWEECLVSLWMLTQSGSTRIR